MLITAIIGWITSLFPERTYQDSVDSYVASKNPTTTAEVEHWIRQYDLNQKGWSL